VLPVGWRYCGAVCAGVLWIIMVIPQPIQFERWWLVINENIRVLTVLVLLVGLDGGSKTLLTQTDNS